MVRLTRIYTRLGDQGSTQLSDRSEVDKTDPRVAAYGDVDEANSWLGLALATATLPTEVATVLRHIQNEMFDLGADLSMPRRADSPGRDLRITPEYVARLEAWCDHFGESLPSLTSFILPGGTPAGASLHVARTVVRRAERVAWRAAELYGTSATRDSEAPGGVNPVALTYLNRLSDLLFILTRVVNGASGEVLWIPGGDRTDR